MTLEIKTVVERCGVAGEPVMGYVEVNALKTTQILTCYVNIFLHSTIHTYAEGSFLFHEYDVINKRINSKSFIDTQSIRVYDCLGFGDKTIREFAPGVYRFPFYFVLPSNFPLTLEISQLNIHAHYTLQGFVVTLKDLLGGKPCSLPILCSRLPDHVFITPEMENSTHLTDEGLEFEVRKSMMLNTQKISNEMNQYNTFPNQSMVVTGENEIPDNIFKQIGSCKTCFIPIKQTFAQGETLVGRITMISQRTIVPKVVISLMGCYFQEGALHTKSYSNITLQQATFDYSQEIQMEIPKTIPPTRISNVFNWEYFVCIAIQETNQKTKKVVMNRACFPITIIAPFISKEQFELYASSIGIKVPNDLESIHDPPPPPTQSGDGTEMAKSVDGRSVLLNHINRTAAVEKVENQENLITLLYPCFTSTTLPPGLSYGKWKDRETIVDHVHNLTIWRFQYEQSHKPQSVLAGNQTSPMLQISVINAVGLKVVSSGVQTYFCRVLGDNGNWIYSKPIKAVDPEFNYDFTLHPAVNRQNVIIYFYVKQGLKGKEFIGFVDIDLTQIPYGSFVEKTYIIEKSPFGNECFTGFVRLSIDYNEHETTNSPPKIINQVIIPTVSNSFPNTKELIKQIEIQNKLRIKHEHNVIYNVVDGRVMVAL